MLPKYRREPPSADDSADTGNREHGDETCCRCRRRADCGADRRALDLASSCAGCIVSPHGVNAGSLRGLYHLSELLEMTLVSDGSTPAIFIVRMTRSASAYES
jgi:hypothetical protein